MRREGERGRGEGEEGGGDGEGEGEEGREGDGGRMCLRFYSGAVMDEVWVFRPPESRREKILQRVTENTRTIDSPERLIQA